MLGSERMEDLELESLPDLELTRPPDLKFGRVFWLVSLGTGQPDFFVPPPDLFEPDRSISMAAR